MHVNSKVKPSVMTQNLVKDQPLNFLKVSEEAIVNSYKFNLKRFDLYDRIMIQLRNEIYFLKINRIVLIIASRDYTEIYTSNKKYIINKCMEEWESRLPNHDFCRVHRSYIVNLNYIRKCTKCSPNKAIITLKEIPIDVKVSRYYYKRIKEFYK